MAAPTINISEIVAEFGAQYKNGGQGLKDLQTVIWQKNETDSLFQLLPTEDTIVYKATASITQVLQAFQTAFTPIGNTKFELESIQLDHVKVDAQITPDELMPSWLGFLAEGKLKRTDWSIVRYWIEQLIVNKMKEDLELYEVFKGVKGAIVEGTPTLQGASINGVRKKIRDGHTAGKTSMITMGAVPTDPVEFVEYLEDMTKQLPELIRQQMTGWNMSKTLRDRFKTGMRTKYNMNYNQATDLLTVIDSDLKVNGLASHAGSAMIWGTIKGNSANPQKWGGNAGVFDVQGFERFVKALSDWWLGYGFWYLPWVYHNDQDLGS